MSSKNLRVRGPEAAAPVTPVTTGSTPYTSLTPGALFGWGAAVVRIEALRDLGRVRVTDVSTGERLDLPTDALHALPGMRAVGFDRVRANPGQWERARALAQDFEAQIDRPRLPLVTTKALAAKYGLSVRQIQRLREQYQAHRRASGLLPDPGGRRRGATALDPRTEQVIAHSIVRYHARRERTSQLEVALRAQSLCRRLRWPVPGISTVVRRIRAAASYEMDRAKLGAKRAQEIWRAVPGTLFVEAPLSVCQIDHTLVDILVLSEDRSRVLGRPWLTVAIDVGTRCVLGIHLTMDAPSSVSVALCVEHATLPKIRENGGRPGLWPMYGKCRLILVDNAREFRGRALEAGCAEHGIELDFRPPGTPRYGGHIERMMGTLMRMVHGLAGTTFSNVQDRGKYPSERRAQMTLSELREWLVTRICQYYHVRRHRALGIAPLVAWERAWTSPSGDLTAPQLMASPDQFRLDFLPCSQRLIRNDGITFRRSRYWHPAMKASIGRDRSVLVRFHPQDLTRIWWREDCGTIVEAQAVAGPAAGQPRAAHTPEETLRMEAIMDEGFATSDRIEAIAQFEFKKRPRSNEQSRPSPGRGGQRRITGSKSEDSVSEETTVVPNRASIRTEEL
ncbi:Mu transposase C-terminal domain-containing protein [Xanthomonas sp. NCPPB 2632]|uniref:Mu transposase C-terminal domain-containing protein n=1 Tax=Xanthomonas sp. NCPPB 2632 TaxID=3240912 RepID=UPI003516693D